jgi:hypothetical protein
MVGSFLCFGSLSDRMQPITYQWKFSVDMAIHRYGEARWETKTKERVEEPPRSRPSGRNRMADIDAAGMVLHFYRRLSRQADAFFICHTIFRPGSALTTTAIIRRRRAPMNSSMKVSSPTCPTAPVARG